MWYLTNTKTQHVYYLVSQSAGHTVGRTGTDLIITGDDSISRNHAMLQPTKNVLNLTDTGSRYGSYVNENIAKTVPISREQATPLQAGDMIRFGRCGSIWQVGKVDFRCLTSTLIMGEELKTILQKIGAEIVLNYTAGLTHLIMPTITITTKFLQCLIGQVPIVKPEYFQTIDRDCIGQSKALPAVKDFVPTCTEPYIRNEPQLFRRNPVRSDLFKGKEFIFLNTVQLRQFENIVKLAGGVCLCAQREKIVKSRFLKPNVITVKMKSCGSSQSQSQSFDTLSQYLTSRGRRMIPDLEIGLALIFCSTEKYCNPEYNFAFNVEERHSSMESGEMLAKNTEQQTENTDTKDTNVHTIPETEPHTESKQKDSIASNQPTSSKAGNMSTRSTSSFLVPKTVSPKANVPEERRKSKRMQEALKDKNQEIDHDESSLPKRPRITVKKQETDHEEHSLSMAPRSTDTPMESVSYSPVVDSKLTETERESSELHIPETRPTPDSALSQALEARGFRAVNRHTMEVGSKRLDKEPAKIQCVVNLNQNIDDDDLLVFDDLAPRKKPRIEKTNDKSSTFNNSSTSGATRSSQVIRNNRNTPVQEDNLLCFDELPTRQQRRTANQRKDHKTTPLDTVNNNVSKSPTVSPDASLSRPVEVQTRSTSNDSTLHSHREFIKPVELSTNGWLSSTFCGLKKTDENDVEKSFNEMKIKSEPLNDVDDPYGFQKDCKKWNKSMENAIPVREVSMKLVAHRPIDVSGQEVSCVAPDGGKNFKAFVKKRNYPVQRIILSTKSVCVGREN